LSLSDVQAAVQASFDSWNKTGASITLHFKDFIDGATVGQDGKNVIFWDETGATPDVKNNGPLGVTTLCVDNRTGEIKEADIVLNGFYGRNAQGIFPIKWVINSQGFGGTPRTFNADVQSTVTHEVGHALGLGHSPVPGATMSVAATSPSFAYSTNQAKLKTDDIDGVTFLYSKTVGFGHGLVNPTLDGNALVANIDYSITSDIGATFGVEWPTITFLPASRYTFTYKSGCPSGTSLGGVSPSATQTLDSGKTIVFVPQCATNKPPVAGLSVSANNVTKIEGQTLMVTVAPSQKATVTFADRSSDPGGVINNWNWQINGAAVELIRGPQSTFSRQLGVGTYSVRLVVSDGRSAPSSPVTVLVVVTESAITTGTISVNATLDGQPWPTSGAGTTSYNLTGASSFTLNGTVVPATYPNIAAGSYVLSYEGGVPPNSRQVGISPCVGPLLTSCTASLAAGQSLTFTIQFVSNLPTAGFTMTSGSQSATEGQTLNVTVPQGGAAIVNFDSTTRSSAVNGATITQWKWSINNLVVATTAILSAQSLSPGTYTVSLMVTDSRGMQSSSVQATVNVSSGPQPVWTQSFPSTTPSAWYSTGMTYDRARSQAVLFGGIINGVGASGQTWVWDGLNWTQKFPNSSPPARQLTSTSALVYDASHQQVVLFGGLANSTFLEDTWIWDGSTWMNKTPQSPQPNPPQDSDYAMAYDAAHQRVVLYGGLHFNGSAYVGLNETWLWDGSTWSRVSPAHDPSNGRSLYAHEMAYDAAHGQVVLFGGLIGGVGASTQTWIWDGADWINKTPAAPLPSPPARSESQTMVYDSTLGAIILFDGGETWSWDGSTWTHIPTAQAPSSRVNFSMAYDEGHNSVVLFGGFSNTSLSDTWILGVGQQATELFQTSLYNDPNLVSYWRFEGNSNDSKGTNNGAASNVLYGAANGKFGQGAAFDGSSSQIVVTDGSTIQPTTITIHLWLYLPFLGSGFPALVDRFNAFTSDGYRMLYAATDGNKIQGNVHTATGDVGGDFSTTLSVGQWYMLDLTWDGSILKLYVNGSPDPTTYSQHAGSITYLTTTNLGMSLRQSGTVSYLRGNLDDVAIFSRALTATEISKLYRGLP